MNALNAQPYNASPPSWVVAAGRIVTTASDSEAVATTTSASPSVSRPSGGLQMLVAFTVAIVASIGGRGVVAPSGAFPAIHHGPRAAVRPKAAHFQSDARSAGFAQITLDAW